ncbi:MAG: sugar phosphate isomerase/epimerase [Chloroflexi bacterium]|nr:sugar phosphate isomerase/epimerase [Chloroflexota bacterium]
MKVGLDTICFSSWKLDAMGLLQKTLDYNLEGLQLGSGLFLDKPEVTEEFTKKLRKHDLFVELTGSGINPRDSGKTVAEMVEPWKRLFPLAAQMGAHNLNTCFGLYQERMMSNFKEQFDGAVQVLKALAPMAADHKVFITVEIHVDLTYRELVNLLDAVDSPWVRAALDTANSLGLMEDPVEAARALAPYAESTHFKDTCVYFTDDGFNWQGGAPIGTGLVDIPAVAELLYKYNPDIHLNIEDGWGSIPIPCYDEAYLNSFPEQNAVRMMQFWKFLREGKRMVDAGIHPRPEDLSKHDVRQAMAGRLWHSANYVRRLRDRIEGR